MTKLLEIGADLFVLDGPVVSFYGFVFPTRMAIARLDGGALWLWSPVALDEDVRREIERLGTPRFAVEPNKLHHLALAQWVAAFPGLVLHAAPGLAKKRADLRFEADLGAEPPAAWRDAIDQVLVPSTLLAEVLFFHRRSSTCLVGDLVQKHDPSAMPRWQRWAMQANGVVGPDGTTPGEWRVLFGSRDAARAAVERALAWDFRHLVIAHGACALENGAAELRKSMQWLLGSTR